MNGRLERLASAEHTLIRAAGTHTSTSPLTVFCHQYSVLTSRMPILSKSDQMPIRRVASSVHVRPDAHQARPHVASRPDGRLVVFVQLSDVASRAV